MPFAEQDDRRHDVIQIGRAEGAGEASLDVGPCARAYEIDVGGAVDLAAAQEESVYAALPGGVEQLAPAVAEAKTLGRAEDADPQAAPRPPFRQQRRRRRHGRNRANRHMTGPRQPPRQSDGEEFARARPQRGGLHAAAGMASNSAARAASKPAPLRAAAHHAASAASSGGYTPASPTGQAPPGASATAST